MRVNVHETIPQIGIGIGFVRIPFHRYSNPSNSVGSLRSRSSSVKNRTA